MRRDAVIIGAGPAGLAAAAFAPEGALVLEARKEPGWKILVSGGGRCNVTNTVPRDEWMRLLEPAGRFLKHALYSFGPEEIRMFLAKLGCPTVEREEGHIYPKSNRAEDVLNAMLAAAQNNGSDIALAARVTGVRRSARGFTVSVKGEEVMCSRLLVAAGTPAFDRPRPGFDEIIRRLGHTVKPWVPALAPVPLEPNPFAGLDGVSVTVRFSIDGKWRDAGEILFVRDGLSGPAMLNASALINRRLLEGRRGDFLVDFLPARRREETLRALAALRDKHPKAGIDRAFEGIIPKRLAERIVDAALKRHATPQVTAAGASVSEAPARRRVTASELKRDEAKAIAEIVHAFPLAAAAIPTFSRGYVASGGIPLDEVNPRTMESRIVPGLFFAGEILDYDAPSGGFNITLALGTGYVAAAGLAAPIV